MERAPLSRCARGRSPQGLLCAAFAIVVAAIAFSCEPVDSLHPLATEADTLFDEHFRGRWSAIDLDSLNYAQFDFDPELGSVLTTGNGVDRSASSVQLVWLGEHWFADMKIRTWESDTNPPTRRSDLERVNRTHMIARLDLDSPDTMTVRCLDDEVLRSYAKRHPGQVHLKRVRSLDDSVWAIKEKTKDLRRFVRRIGGDDSLFLLDLTFVRVR